jgi:hypothetical protein
VTARPSGLPPPARTDDPAELCTFCVAAPGGSDGHSGFAQQVHKIPPTDRSYVTLACVYCGATWVRRRINAKTFEWLRLAQ